MKTLLALAAVLLALPATAQRAPIAVQSHFGTVGGLGGNVGIGAEFSVTGYGSALVAVGAVLDGRNGTKAYFPLDFSVGARVYPFQEWLYGELAYGYVGTQARYYPETQTYGDVTTERAFSYALGIRTSSWKGLFAGASIGGAFGDEDRFPYNDTALSRIGLTLGVELGR